MALAAVFGVAVLLLYYLLAQSIPDYDRSFEVAGASGRIEIVRDNRAVPHIFAEKEIDVFFGLGFAHAQDRLWQMLMLRRTVQGRLSELFGRDTLTVDRFIRNLDLYGVSQAGLEFQTPETIEKLEAYAAGVNAHLAAVRDEALGRGAPELFLFSADIAPWTPVDSMGVLRLMALQLTDQAATEVLHGRLALLLEEERLKDLFPDDLGTPRMALPDYAALYGAEPPEGDVELAHHPLLPLAAPGFAGASNAFAVTAERSATDGTLLATDPHLALSTPSIWMLARLEFAEGGVIGATIPGLPAILIGRNSSFGWGQTASYLDDQDILIDKLHPEDPNRYLTPDGYRKFDTRDAIVKIKDEPGETITYQYTQHGPIIGTDPWGLKGLLPPGHVASLAWTALDPDEQSMGAVLTLMRARSVDEAMAIVEKVAYPANNLIMADRRSIAIQTMGRAPRRNPNHTSRGRLPAPGWLIQNAWDGYLPFEDNPKIKNPESGVVVNTNNRLTDAAFPRHWSYDWGDTQRILRAERMLNGREFHTLDSFIEIQTDTVSSAARTLIPLMARDLWWTGPPGAPGTTENLRHQALERLANWNGEMSEHDAEPLIYAAWVQTVQRLLMIDDIGKLADQITTTRPLFLERVFRDIDGASAWCDIRQTSPIETCSEIAERALDQALIDIAAERGDRIESWRWGDAHQAFHKHAVLGSIPILSWFVNIVQDTPGGRQHIAARQDDRHWRQTVPERACRRFSGDLRFRRPGSVRFYPVNRSIGAFSVASLRRSRPDLAALRIRAHDT